MHDDRKLFSTHRLSNGVTVYSHAMDVPYFSIHVIAPVGSAHSHGGNPGGRMGMAHFMEHTIFHRSKMHTEKGSFEKLIALKGGYWNAATGPRATDIHLTVALDAQQEAIDGLLSHLLHPIITEDDLATERGIVRNERDQRRYYPSDSEEGRYLDLEWMHTQWYSREQLFGSDEDLEAMTPDSVHAFLRHYASNNLRVVIGGGHRLAPVLEAFAAIPTEALTLSEQVEPVRWVNRAYHEKAFRDVGTPTYHLGSLTPSCDFQEAYALRFMLGFLANYVHGPLYEWLRKENGWTYGIEYGTSAAQDRTEGILRIPLNTAEAIPIIREEIHGRIRAALADTTLVASEVARRNHERLFHYQTLDERLFEAVSELENHERIVTEAEYRRMNEQFTDTTLLTKAYETYLAPDVAGEVVLLPLADAD